MAVALAWQRPEPPTSQDALGSVYSATRAATDDPALAEHVTTWVLARSEPEDTVDDLTARAVHLTLRARPVAPFDRLPQPERDAIGLARLGGLDVDAIARFLAVPPAEVRALMMAGLRRLAAG